MTAAPHHATAFQILVQKVRLLEQFLVQLERVWPSLVEVALVADVLVRVARVVVGPVEVFKLVFKEFGGGHGRELGQQVRQAAFWKLVHVRVHYLVKLVFRQNQLVLAVLEGQVLRRC